MRLISDRTGTHSEAPRYLERRPLEADRHWRMLQSTGVRLHAAFAKRSEHCALAVLDGDGVVVSWYDQLFGAARIAASVVDRHVSQFYVESDVAAGEPSRSLRSAADCGVDVQEGWRRRPGGAVYWGSTAIQTVLDGDRRVLGFAHITRRVQGPWGVTHLAMSGHRQTRRTRLPRLRVLGVDAPAQVAL